MPKCPNELLYFFSGASLNFVLRALRALRPCDPRNNGASGEILMPVCEKYLRRNESAFFVTDGQTEDRQTEDRQTELGILGS